MYTFVSQKDDQYVPVSCCKLSNKDVKNPMPVNYAQCQKDAMTSAKDSQNLNTKVNSQIIVYIVLIFFFFLKINYFTIVNT